jgi:hypothetical protein
MGFLGIIFKQGKYTDKYKTITKPDRTTKTAGFFDTTYGRIKAYAGWRTAKYVCELNIDGEKYMLEKFDMDFSDQQNRHHIPIFLVFADTLPLSLEAWITQSTQRKNGIFKFFAKKVLIDESALFSIEFYDAVCTGYHKKINENRVETTLTLLVKRLKLQDEEIEM